MFNRVRGARYGKQTKQNDSVSHENPRSHCGGWHYLMVGRQHESSAIQGSDCRSDAAAAAAAAAAVLPRGVSAETLVVRWSDAARSRSFRFH
jgi:hypothetical protein